MKYYKISALVMSAIMLASTVVQASEQQVKFFDRIDIIVIVDESGSLMHTDPEQMRFEALEMLRGFSTGVVGKVFRGCLIGFSDDVNFYTPQGIFVPFSEMSSYIPMLRGAELGRFTDIKKALKVSYQVFENRERKYPGYVVLFTDGQPEPDISLDVDPQPIMKQYMEDLYAVVSTYRDSGLKICPIAFSDNVDEAFLQSIAASTNGRVFEAKKPEDIAPALSEFFQIPHSTKVEKTPDFDLLKDNYERHIEVSEGTAELRVEVFKKVPSDKVPEIALLTPQGGEITPPLVKTRTAAIASVSNPAPPGTWTVRITGKDIGRVDIILSQLSGLKLQVLTPKVGTKYKNVVPISVRLYSLIPEYSTRVERIIARVKWLDGEQAGKWDKPVELKTKTGEQYDWSGEYFIKHKGSHSSFFDVEIGKVAYSSSEIVNFEGEFIPPPPEPEVTVKELSPAIPADIKSGENATQKFEIEAKNLIHDVDYSEVKMRDTPPEGLNISLTKKLRLESNKRGDFNVEISTNMPLPIEKIKYKATLIPESPPEALKEKLTIDFDVGPIGGKPVLKLMQDPKKDIYYLGQTIIFKATTSSPVNVKNVEVVGSNPIKESKAISLNRKENGMYSGEFKPQEIKELGEWSFVLAESDAFERAPKDETPVKLTINVLDATFTASPTDKKYKVKRSGERSAVLIPIEVNAVNLHSHREVKFKLSDNRVRILGDPTSITLEPSKASGKKEISIGIVGDELPTQRGWEISGTLHDAKTDIELASFIFSIRGPTPAAVYVFVIVVCALIAFFAFFALRPNFDRELQLVMMTSSGRIETEYDLRALVGFFKRAITIGSSKDDIDIEESVTAFKIVPHFGGRTSLTPLQNDKVQSESSGKVEYVNERISLSRGDVIVVGRRRMTLRRD